LIRSPSHPARSGRGSTTAAPRSTPAATFRLALRKHPSSLRASAGRPASAVALAGPGFAAPPRRAAFLPARGGPTLSAASAHHTPAATRRPAVVLAAAGHEMARPSVRLGSPPVP